MAPAVTPALSLQVHNLTLRAKGKILLEGAHLAITAGRRYSSGRVGTPLSSKRKARARR